MDETDRRILMALARDARASHQAVADAVGVRRATVHERLKRLENAGVVRGYQVALDPDAAEAGLLAFVLLELEVGPGKDCLERCANVAERLRAMPEVLEFHTVAGATDALAKVRAKDVRALERVILRGISGTAGVRRVQTLLALSTQFERPLTVLVTPPKPRSAGVSRRPTGKR